ncbi:MAG: hypothetical protein FJW90_03905 [Actinobacteria bacterium]|nr:hypothetical protein [Actinomycetota bacterium]
MHRLRVPITALTALAATFAFAACGGDSGGDEDPEQVLRATFDNDAEVSSGVFEVSLDVEAEGGSDPGTLSVSIGGPFQSGEGGVPLFDVTAEADVDSTEQQFEGDAGFISTGDTAYVSFQGSDYELPAEVFAQFERGFLDSQDEQESDNVLPSLGVNPSSWLTDLSNEGTEDVEGTETIQISGQADVPDLVADLRTIADNIPEAAQQLSPADLSQLEQLTGIIKSADFNIYSGADDEILRKLEADIELDPPDASGGAESVDINFAITLSELNEPQTISAPPGAQPLSTLLEQFGVDPSQLGGLGAIGGGSSSGSSPSGGSAAGTAYLDCIAQAQDASALAQCQGLAEQ